MAHSRHIKSIHADNPNTSYEELREHLKTIVEWELSVSRDDLNDPESYQLYVDQYDDIKSNLQEAVATERLIVDQHRYINDVIGVLKPVRIDSKVIALACCLTLSRRPAV